MPKTIAEVLPDLGQYYGTLGYLRHRPFGGPSILLTDGARYVAETAGAFWLMDEIARGCKEWLLEGTGFVVVRLRVEENSSAKLVVEDGNDNVLHEKAIWFTDFPRPGIEFYLQGGDGVEPVLMLKSEY